MDLALLGPVELTVCGQRVGLRRRQERCLLAILAIEPGRLVPTERLVDLLWGDAPPPRARTAIHAAVSHLRSSLRPAQAEGVRLLTRGGGYLLQIEPDQIDLHRFRSLVARGRAAAGLERVRLLGAALALWRGPALADAVDEAQRARLCPDLDDLYHCAREDWLQARLDNGEGQQLVQPLQAALAEYPLRERPYGQLMVALYRAGRRADALEVYQLARRVLVAELGLDPGPELSQLEQAVLTDDPAALTAPREPAAPVPAQLPADLAGFAGRARYLAELDALLSGSDQPAGVVIATLAGSAGVGKTTLAVHWAHQVAGRFPDGQLYLNLRGFDPAGPAVEPGAAVRAFLDALGVPAARVPTGLDAQAALYRSLLAGRRMLVLLDNARDAEQVRPLLPGAPGCFALVTSRDELAGLVVAQHARVLTLDLLGAQDARELLAQRLGAQRVDAEPVAVAQIIDRCACLPLALAIAAGRAAGRPDFPLSRLAAELTAAGEAGEAGSRLDAFAGRDAATNVRAVFSWSYRTLDAAAARLFRLIGLAPGADIATAAAASLAAVPLPRARALLADLTRAHLLREHRPDRYTCHDLLRAYAAELVGTQDPLPARQAATHRILDHYLHSARTAAMRLEPQRVPVEAPPPRSGVRPQAPPDQEQALAWFTAEGRVLLAAIEQAARAGFHRHVGALAWSVTDFLQRQGLWYEQAGVHRHALEAAQRLDDEAEQARAHRHLGRAYTLLGRHAEADEHYRQALELAARLGDRNGQAHTHMNLANAREQEGDHARALAHARQAVDLFRAAGIRSGEARALNSMGWAYAHLGEYRRGLQCCDQAMVLLREEDDRTGEAYTLDSLGYAHRGLGDLTEAVRCYRAAVEVFRETGERYYEASSLQHLGDTQAQAGQVAAARDSWQRSLSILAALGHPDADQLRASLSGVPPTPSTSAAPASTDQ